MSVDTLTVTSTAFSANGYIPVKYTGYGLDISPPLTMSGISPAAKSLVIIMDDIDHPIPSYNHWVIWNIPNMSTIPENIPHGDRIAELGGAVQGRGYGKNRYREPKPPFNWSHRYQYKVYALDALLGLPSDSRKKDLPKAMQGHVLQEGFII